MNTLHKLHLVEAERYRVWQKPAIAADFYERAITGAKDHGYPQEAALANELAAKFYLDWGKEKAAAGYLQAAYYGYAHWGAKAKTQDLEHRYPHLLQPVIQPTMVSPLATLEMIATPHLALQGTVDLDQTVGHQLNHLHSGLDFATLIKTSQALAKTVQLDDLLRQLTQILLQTSGGDRCILILPEAQDSWQVRAMATPEKIELGNVPFEDSPEVPIKLVQYVKHTQEVVIIDDHQADMPVIDQWLNQRQPKSLLGIPILNQGRLLGVIQLSHQSASGEFTSTPNLMYTFW